MDTSVGTVFYVTFGEEPVRDGGVRKLTWLCPECDRTHDVNALLLDEDLQCGRCGIIIVPALGLGGAVRGEGRYRIEVDADGNLHPMEGIYGMPTWWATRMWKYTIKAKGERPNRFQLLYEEELEGESIDIKDPGTYSEAEAFETLWAKDPVEDWEESERARQDYMDNQLSGVRVKRHGSTSSMFIRPGQRREDEG